MSVIGFATASKTGLSAWYRRTLTGAALAAGILLALPTGTAQAQPSACTVANFQAASDISAFINSLLAAGATGADIAACAEFLELVFVNNVFILSTEDYQAMHAAAVALRGVTLAGGNAGNGGGGGNGGNGGNGNAGTGNGSNGSGQPTTTTTNTTVTVPSLISDPGDVLALGNARTAFDRIRTSWTPADTSLDVDQLGDALVVIPTELGNVAIRPFTPPIPSVLGVVPLTVFSAFAFTSTGSTATDELLSEIWTNSARIALAMGAAGNNASGHTPSSLLRLGVASLFLDDPDAVGTTAGAFFDGTAPLAPKYLINVVNCPPGCLDSDLQLAAQAALEASEAITSIDSLLTPQTTGGTTQTTSFVPVGGF